MSGAGLLALGLFSLGLSFLAAPAMIWGLRRLGLGKVIRQEGPPSHQSKTGTPTMGGWLVIGSTLVTMSLFVRQKEIAIPMAAMLTFGMMGSLDDYINAKSLKNHGLPVRLKFLVHGLVALVVAYVIYRYAGITVVNVPGYGIMDIGWWIIPLGGLAIFATAAGVNEIDGLDGLAAGTTAIALAAYLAIAIANGQSHLAAVAAAVIGSLVAFLWFNINPARVFLGDAGALALGSTLGVLAVMTEQPLLLPIIGFVFVIDLVSVMVQVAYFKWSGGRRLFKMSPLHHHLELSGWRETEVVERFWLVAAVTAALGTLPALM